MMRSDKPNAKNFRLWITKEVIPSIRKTGSYSVKPMSQAELLLQQAQILVDLERKQNEQQLQLQQLSEKTDKIEKDFTYIQSKTNNTPDYYSVVGYCALKGIDIDLKEAKKIGRAASKFCKENNLSIDSLPDPRFGRINTYPYRVLDSIIKRKMQQEVATLSIFV